MESDVSSAPKDSKCSALNVGVSPSANFPGVGSNLAAAAMQYLTSLHSNSPAVNSSAFAMPNFVTSLNSQASSDDSSVAMQLLGARTRNATSEKEAKPFVNADLSKLTSLIQSNPLPGAAEVKNASQKSGTGAVNSANTGATLAAMLRALSTPGAELPAPDESSLVNPLNVSAATAAAAMLQLTYASNLQNQFNIAQSNNLQSKVIKSLFLITPR